MPETDLGRVAMGRLQELLRVVCTRLPGVNGFTWSCWGVSQRVWSEVWRDDVGRPHWRVQLRTLALTGFHGSLEQTRTLSSGGCPALSGLVRHADRQEALELGIGLDVHAGNIDWVVRVLDTAARVQATETHIMALSFDFADTGLQPQASIEDWTHPLMRSGAFPIEEDAHEPNVPCWRDAAVASYVDLLRSLGAHAVQTPNGITATLPRSRSDDNRSILEIAERSHPALGPGLSVVIWTPVRDGLVGAIAANERESGPHAAAGLSLGGWWAAEGGLRRHVSFYPYCLRRDGVVPQMLRAAVRRALA